MWWVKYVLNVIVVVQERKTGQKGERKVGRRQYGRGVSNGGEG
jgi:hypothetical protein